MKGDKSVAVLCLLYGLIGSISHVLCSTDDLDNFISPEDLDLILSNSLMSTPTPLAPYPDVNPFDDPAYTNISSETQHNITSDCFGLGAVTSKLRWFLNLRPQHSDKIAVEFFMASRKQRTRVQVMPGDQFGLDWTYYDSNKPTVVIVHGFLSYSRASWVVNMTRAFLDWGDVNVITVDWSKGGKTWKYWRAVANTRTVGADLARFLQQLMDASGAQTKDFHFVGHSLGAHICAYAANILKGVRRITGLDPAQPCFITTDLNMLLDKTDADFVDVIHTNGRELSKWGLGIPNTCGDQDFFPNGGMKQPGCQMGKSTFIDKIWPNQRLKRAVCNHGRAHVLFTESLKSHNCSLVGHQWNLSYSGVNASISLRCTNSSCSVMGINADKYPARGSFYVVTTAKRPFCELIPKKIETRGFLLSDIINRTEVLSTTPYLNEMLSSTSEQPPTKKSSWFSGFPWFGK